MKYILSLFLNNKKRFFETLAIVLCLVLLVYLNRIGAEIFSFGKLLSENREFLSTLIYFALINLNIILILILTFLLFRKVTRLIIERKQGVIGSKLRSKLVVALVFFALAPTMLLFYVTTQFIMTSYETWFSEKVQTTIERTREAGSHIYKQDQKRLEGVAKIAKEYVTWKQLPEIFSSNSRIVPSKKLEKFSKKYGVDSLKIYSVSGKLIWSDLELNKIKYSEFDYPRSLILHFLKNPNHTSHSSLYGAGNTDVVVGGAPLRNPKTGFLEGIIIVEAHFETQILKSVENILNDFERLKPGAQVIRVSHMVLIVLIVLLIIFTATWLGFYVAREIISPIQNLAEATKTVALGNYNVSLKVEGDDETSHLVNSFNKMTRDLYEQRENTRKAQTHLQKTNEELDHKRQYLEIVLEHVSAGVLSISSDFKITSINSAAEDLLKLTKRSIEGLTIHSAMGKGLYEAFWTPIYEELIKEDSFNGQLELKKIGIEATLIVNAVRVRDERDVNLGFVLVFDDAIDKVRSQKIIAWREVARRIAHEIKNPITPIKLNAQRLVRKFSNQFTSEDREIFESCMETIIVQVDSLRDLVNEFSKFSKMPNIKPRDTNLHALIYKAVHLFRMSYPDICFTVSGFEKMPIFQLDKEQLNRALVNILKNAVFSIKKGSKGFVEIKGEIVRDLKIMKILIADNGCGISEELKTRVLEPYFSTKQEGTGLGLAIVHQVVTEHGGYLRLLDNKPYGTVVVIELPY